MLIDSNKDDKFVNGRFYFVLAGVKRAGFYDFTNIPQEKTLEVVNEFIDFFKKNEIMNPTGRVIMDFSGTHLNREVTDALKEMAAEVKKYTSIKTRAAVVGVSKIQRIFVNTFNRITKTDMRAFDTKEEAYHWLAEVDKFEKEQGDI